jgi:sugar fermentation stimulation protein A
MRFTFQALPAKFVSRPNRFVVVAELCDSRETVLAHCADPGRMRELLLPGTPIYLSKSANANRKTAYDLRFVVHPETGQLISVDTQLPNRVFANAMHDGTIPPLSHYRLIRREVTVPEEHVDCGQTRSRLDFVLEDNDSVPIWVEVKSVTLVKDRLALFPDAPTERGRRHVLELAKLKQRGGVRSAVVFMVQRADADLFRPNREIDPDFADALEYAVDEGVEVYAYTCKLSLEEIRVDRRIEVAVSVSD